MATVETNQPGFIKKHWGKILVGVLATSVLTNIIQDRHPQSTATPLAKPLLSAKESELLNLFLQDEAEMMATDQDSLFKPSNLGFSAYIADTALSRAYHQNEVAADDKYKGKDLLVAGRIQSIDKDFMDNAILRLRGTQMFMDVTAYMDQSELPDLANMRKGQEITLSCEGSGMVIGSAVLKNCRNAQKDIFERLTRKTNQVLEGRDKDETAQALISQIRYWAQNLKPSSECWKFVSSPSCIKDVEVLKSASKTQ